MSDDWNPGHLPESDEVREEREGTEQEVQLAARALQEIEERSRYWDNGNQAFIAGLMLARGIKMRDNAFKGTQ